MRPERLVILGGTGEAVELARAAFARFGDRLQVTTSSVGRTRRAAPVPGQIRVGGFGGPAGLTAYLTENGFDRLIDATHPFATRISASARLACERAQVPRLMLLRPPWRRHPLDRWIEVDDMGEAATMLRSIGRRVWITIGSSDIGCFSRVAGTHFLVRLIDPPRRPLPLASYEVILGRGPFTLAGERRLIDQYAIDVLVCKASGGAATEAKLAAARERGLPVVMVRRPPPEPGDAVDTVAAALDWLASPCFLPEAKRGL